MGIGCLVGYLRAKVIPATPVNELKEGGEEVKATVEAIGPLLKSPISHQGSILHAVLFIGGGGLNKGLEAGEQGGMWRTKCKDTSTSFGRVSPRRTSSTTELELLNLMELNWF